MTTITRIVQQKDQNRANIYLDGKFAFGITLEALLSHSLHTSKELTQNEIAKLKDEDGQAKITNRAIEFAIRRPRSEKEIKLWFKRKKVEESVQGVALNKLKKLGLVDDLNFAKWWIEQRNTFRPKPQKVIKLELRQKGVEKSIIEEALEGSEEVDELETARKVIARKIERYQKMPYDESRKKLSNFLAMRGFSWEIIRQIVDENLKK